MANHDGVDEPEAVSVFDLTVRGDGIESFVGDVANDGVENRGSLYVLFHDTPHFNHVSILNVEN